MTHRIGTSRDRKVQPPDCPYCGRSSELLRDSSEVYERNFGPLWICWPCYAWVGCHRNTIVPLGRLANSELRKAKQEAHRFFDALWKEKRRRQGNSGGQARRDGHLWLAAQLGIPSAECHIGMFDVAMCRRVVEICAPYVRAFAA